MKFLLNLEILEPRNLEPRNSSTYEVFIEPRIEIIEPNSGTYEVDKNTNLGIAFARYHRDQSRAKHPKMQVPNHNKKELCQETFQQHFLILHFLGLE